MPKVGFGTVFHEGCRLAEEISPVTNSITESEEGRESDEFNELLLLSLEGTSYSGVQSRLSECCKVWLVYACRMPSKRLLIRE